MDGYLGQIMLFAGNFTIKNWMQCNGAILAVSEYQALFSLIGNTYGGNGSTSFALPNMSARIPIGIGKGPVLSTSFTLGDCSDVCTTTLSTKNLPVHSHGFPVSQDVATEISPEGAMPAALSDNNVFYSNIPDGETGTSYSMADKAVSASGEGEAFSTIAPCVGLTYQICVNGVYPSRS